MTMHLFILTEAVEAPDYDPVWGSTVVRVQGRDWHRARAQCAQQAALKGHNHIVIMSAGVELLHRAHWNGRGEATEPRRLNDCGRHGVWLYLDRLLRRFGHVYVPPVDWCRPWPATQAKHPVKWDYFNQPTIPMVSAYKTHALMEIGKLETPGWGQRLCAAGYDSFTVSDYFFNHLSGPAFDEEGTASSWSKAYERAIQTFLR